MEKEKFPNLLEIAQRISVISEKLDKISDYMCTLTDNLKTEDDLIKSFAEVLSTLCCDAKLYAEDLHESLPSINRTQWNELQVKFDVIVEDLK